MPELKPIAKESVPRALLKAERYRLLNEPREAESICRDCLAVDHANQDALRCLILSLTDQFGSMQARADEARPFLSQLSDPFDRSYYAGVIEERWGKALLTGGYPAELVRERLLEAMRLFESADTCAPAGNDDAVLRWNACVRLMERHGFTAQSEEAEPSPETFDDDVPMR